MLSLMPVQSNARSVVMLQQLGGIMYLAMVVSRLMNMVSVRRKRDFGRP